MLSPAFPLCFIQNPLKASKIFHKPKSNSMDSSFQSLPPLKRFRLLQQQEEEQIQNQESSESKTSPSCLPAKKRKRSLCPPAEPSTYCLPAKKRVWALQPHLLDLNVEWKPPTKGKKQNHGDNNGGEEEDDDDGIVCAVCQSTDGDQVDPIVLCDGCDLMVHTTCYGSPLVDAIPEGDWFCAQCSSSASHSCCLCPNKGGAMKPTKDGSWAHLVCAVFVPEVFFDDPEGREGIDCSKVLKTRWENRCYVCRTKRGCAVECSEPKCPLWFHVTCGLKEDLCIEYRERKKGAAVVAGFCKDHTQLWKKQQQSGKFKIVAREDYK